MMLAKIKTTSGQRHAWAGYAHGGSANLFQLKYSESCYDTYSHVLFNVEMLSFNILAFIYYDLVIYSFISLESHFFKSVP